MVFSHRLTGKFSEFGKTDFSLLIYSEYQKCGTGRRVVDLLLSQSKEAVFIVSETNRISLSLFQSIESLSSTQSWVSFLCLRIQFKLTIDYKFLTSEKINVGDIVALKSDDSARLAVLEIGVGEDPECKVFSNGKLENYFLSQLSRISEETRGQSH